MYIAYKLSTKEKPMSSKRWGQCDKKHRSYTNRFRVTSSVDGEFTWVKFFTRCQCGSSVKPHPDDGEWMKTDKIEELRQNPNWTEENI